MFFSVDVMLPNEFPEGFTGRVTVNDEDAEYIRTDPLKVCFPNFWRYQAISVL